MVLLIIYLLISVYLISKFFKINIFLGFLSIIVLGMGSVYLFQHLIMYMPIIPNFSQSPNDNKLNYRHPIERGIPTRNVTIKSGNYLIKGWLLQNNKSQDLIVFYHQNAGNLGFRIKYLQHLYNYTKANILLVAYRGYSDSQGSPSEEGLQIDAQAIMDFAINQSNHRHPKLNIYIFGRSLGGAVSIYVTSLQKYKNKIKGLILQNTFTSISDMVDIMFPLLKYFKSILLRNHWPSVQRISNISIPILFFRSVKDQIVPTQQMIQLYHNATSSLFKQQLVIQEGKHDFGWFVDPNRYFNKFIQFIQNTKAKNISQNIKIQERIIQNIKIIQQTNQNNDL